MSHDDSLEPRYRLLLRCYPRRWRQEHGDELLTLLLDAAPPDKRLPFGDAADLVVKGSATRARFALRQARNEPAL